MSDIVDVVGAAAVENPAIAQREGEEELMTPYAPTDLDEHWEFKILRATTTKFRDPAQLKAIPEEETRAGWTMVEKSDDSRIRLERHVSSRKRDATLDFDPYRTWVGVGQTRVALLVVFGVPVGMVAVVALITLIVSAHR